MYCRSTVEQCHRLSWPGGRFIYMYCRSTVEQCHRLGWPGVGLYVLHEYSSTVSQAGLARG